jgi:peptidoglycan/xylan/chitin deacetylase (PgdA/CDA1 family)/glycosyltransferase involved in cell wall biosynthesis
VRTSPLVSVIIPTHRRPQALARVLAALAQQTFPPCDFEVVVVMDGACEPTRRLLGEASFPFRLRWFERPQRGVTAARNFAIQEAEADILLFLDDDIIPVPQLLARHYACHKHETRLVVLGALKIHPDSPERFLGQIYDFTRPVFERCSIAGHKPNHLDFLDGNHSVRKEFAAQVGGWDESLVGFGGLCDTEIGYRYHRMGLRFHFEPEALGYHYYVKPLGQNLEDMRYAGGAQLWYFRKYPHRVRDLRFPVLVTGPWWKRGILRLARVVPESAFSFLSKTLARRVHGWQPRRAVKMAQVAVRFLMGLFFCRGFWDEAAEMEQAYRQLRLRVPILAYHRVAPRAEGDSYLTVAVEEFRSQMEWLSNWGYTTVSLQDLCEWQTSLRPLPSKPVILSFDDGYRGLREYVAPVLKRHGFRATVFLIAGKLGQTVVWEDGRPLTIMDREEVRELAEMGFDIQGHGAVHHDWTRVAQELVRRDLAESARIIEDISGCPVRFFAYPFGRWTPEVRDLVEHAGFAGACTIEFGRNDFNQDRFLLNRYMVWPRTKVWRFARELRR